MAEIKWDWWIRGLDLEYRGDKHGQVEWRLVGGQWMASTMETEAQVRERHHPIGFVDVLPRPYTDADVRRLVELQWAASYCQHEWKDLDNETKGVFLRCADADARAFLADYAEFKAKELSEDSTAQQSDRTTAGGGK